MLQKVSRDFRQVALTPSVRGSTENFLRVAIEGSKCSFQKLLWLAAAAQIAKSTAAAAAADAENARIIYVVRLALAANSLAHRAEMPSRAVGGATNTIAYIRGKTFRHAN